MATTTESNNGLYFIVGALVVVAMVFALYVFGDHSTSIPSLTSGPTSVEQSSSSNTVTEPVTGATTTTTTETTKSTEQQ